MKYIIIFITLLTIPMCLFATQKIETFSDQFSITYEIEKDYYYGEPIPVKVTYKNISETDAIKEINLKYGGPDIYGDNYKPFNISPMPAVPLTKKITLKPGEHLICEYLIQAFGNKNYINYGYPTGNYYIKLDEKILSFYVENNPNFIPAMQYLRNELYTPGKKNLKEIENIYVSLNKQDLNEDLKLALDFYFLVKCVHFYNLAEINEEFKDEYNKSLYKIKDPITKCYEFLQKYPTSIYYSNYIRALLFEQIAKSGVNEFKQLLEGKNEEFKINTVQIIVLKEKYKKKYNIQ